MRRLCTVIFEMFLWPVWTFFCLNLLIDLWCFYSQMNFLFKYNIKNDVNTENYEISCWLKKIFREICFSFLIQCCPITFNNVNNLHQTYKEFIFHSKPQQRSSEFYAHVLSRLYLLQYHITRSRTSMLQQYTSHITILFYY